MPIRIALVGVGKIARDQHVPALAANSSYALVAAASPHHRLDGVLHFNSIEAMLGERNRGNEPHRDASRTLVDEIRRELREVAGIVLA